MAIKAKSYEKLSHENIQRVIDHLEQDDPITKKEACEMLNIRYNTTRLQRIIDDYLEIQAYRDKRKSQNKGKAASKDEIKTVVQSYLDGYNISQIANSLYRSPAFVKNIVDRVGIPQRLAESDYEGMRKGMLPEQCVQEEFEVGERVWYPRKNRFAEIKCEVTQLLQYQNRGYFGYQDMSKCVNYEDKYGAKMYKLYVLDPVPQEVMAQTLFPWLDGDRVGFHASALAYDIGSLRHLKEYL